MRLANPAAPTIFQKLGVRPVINASGVYTDLGGTVLSPTVWAAMQEMNSSAVRMVELLDTTGKRIAELMDAEAARVTPGASAAIALGTAACMAGMNGKHWEQLPDTTGMKDEVVIQKRHRYKYDRCARIPGAKLVEAGNANGTTLAQLEAAISPQTAMILFPAHVSDKPGTVSLRDVTAVSKRRGVPTMVDAAYLNYPVSRMSSFGQSGADLVCFSAKYFWGPNSGGLIYGRKELIDAVSGIDFTRYESGKYLTFGRPFKLDRQIITGVVVALEDWLAMDHDARWRGYAEKVNDVMLALHNAPYPMQPMYFTMDERLEPSPVNCLAIRFPDAAAAERICSRLAAGEPSIATVTVVEQLVIAMDTILDGQERQIAARLQAELKQS
jgi:D-glucosaminate-6-phosphate ammonia-lyase